MKLQLIKVENKVSSQIKKPRLAIANINNNLCKTKAKAINQKEAQRKAKNLTTDLDTNANAEDIDTKITAEELDTHINTRETDIVVKEGDSETATKTKDADAGPVTLSPLRPDNNDFKEVQGTINKTHTEYQGRSPIDGNPPGRTWRT